MTNWRDIRACVIDWQNNPISRQAGNYLTGACRDAHHCFSTATLGEIANMGIQDWVRQPLIGPLAAEVIMWVIDEAAEGRCNVVNAKHPVNTPYIPKAER